jgi:tryptophanyl-tRNA synthetase
MIGTKVYSTIQQIRDAKRRERQRKWKQKIEESRIKRIVSLSLGGSEKKADGKYNKIYKSGSRKKDKCKRNKTEK